MIFWAPGPWLTRDLKRCVLADEYDALLKRVTDLEKAGDRLAHELLFAEHQTELSAWWKLRDGQCTFCNGPGDE